MALSTIPRDASSDGAATTAFGLREAVLRRRLTEDPNDARAFRRLVTLLSRIGPGHLSSTEPAGSDTRDDVTWALAEELARNPRAWYPLIELARLSLHEDAETAVRKLVTACERDPKGHALTRAVELLRRASRPDEGFRLALAQWRPQDHHLEAGRQFVLAGLESGRVAEARRHLEAVASRPGGGAAAQLRAELTRRLAVATVADSATVTGKSLRAGARLVDRIRRLVVPEEGVATR